MIATRFQPLTAAALLLFVAGCGKKSAGPPAAGHPLPAPLVAKCEPGQPGGKLTLVTAGAPRTFNPLFATDSASDEVVRLLFGALVNVDMTTQEARPGLAESWTVAPDQKTWTFKLRPELRWSDGHPLTADDVAFTWNEVMFNPEFNQLTYDLFRINLTNFTVTKLDDLTVRVVTPEVFAPFLEFFGGVAILPQHIIGPAVRSRRFLPVYSLTTPPERVVGCGPFRVKESLPGKPIRLERNPEYWAVDSAGHRLPYFDEVEIISSGPGAAALLFLNGQGDVYEHSRPSDYAQFKAAAHEKFNLVELGLGTERDFLWFNQNTGTNAAGRLIVPPAKLNWFRNKKFRQAVSCALDRGRLLQQVYGGRGEAIHTFVTAENRKWNNPNVPSFAYDPARARALLAEIGIQDRDGDGVLEDAAGSQIEFTFHSNTGNPTRERCAGLIAEDLRKLGMKVDLRLVDFKSLLVRINASDEYECLLMGVGGGGVDPASQINVLKSGEPLHQWFPNQKTPATEWEARIDVLMDAQMRTLDFATRKKAFEEVQAILAEELPLIQTVAPHHFAAVRTNLANLRPTVLTPYRVTWNAEELYFKKP